MLEYQLQFFAKDGPGGEKTEQPTSKKLEDARKEGQVAKSKEVANAAGILALFLIVRFYAGTLGEGFVNFSGECTMRFRMPSRCLTVLFRLQQFP